MARRVPAGNRAQKAVLEMKLDGRPLSAELAARARELAGYEIEREHQRLCLWARDENGRTLLDVINTERAEAVRAAKTAQAWEP